MSNIFQPIQVGPYELQNRIVMAPMTRSRAKADGTPGDAAATYYAQRASVGLIVTEGTQPSDDGQGYLTTPGIYTPEHVAGWRKVTEAVHAKGGRIFIQLMHAGRMSHPDNTPHHRLGVAPSAVAPGSQMFTATGMKDIPTPRALSTEEVRQTVQDFRHAARQAIEAARIRSEQSLEQERIRKEREIQSAEIERRKALELAEQQRAIAFLQT